MSSNHQVAKVESGNGAWRFLTLVLAGVFCLSIACSDGRSGYDGGPAGREPTNFELLLIFMLLFVVPAVWWLVRQQDEEARQRGAALLQEEAEEREWAELDDAIAEDPEDDADGRQHNSDYSI